MEVTELRHTCLAGECSGGVQVYYALEALVRVGLVAMLVLFDVTQGGLEVGVHACESVGVQDWSRTNYSGLSERGHEKVPKPDTLMYFNETSSCFKGKPSGHM